MKYSIDTLASVLKIRNIKNNGYDISYLLTDSREMFSPIFSLFFALKTKNDDGHKYVDELYDLGVRNFVVQEIKEQWNSYSDANFLQVKDTLSALQSIATFHRKNFDIPVIAITGSNGKTVTKEWIAHILSTTKKVTRSPRSYNSQIGVPLSVWQLDEHSEIGLFEAGISLPNEMVRLQKVIQPTIGVFTNIGDAHQENFKNLKQKCLEKLELFINSEVIICNADDHLLEECMEEACLTPKRFTWSRNPLSNSHLVLKNLEHHDNHSTLTYSMLEYEFSVSLPFVDDASIENVTNAIAVAFYLNIPINILEQQVSTLESVAMRLDVRRGKNNNILVNDAYNSDINSLRIALSFLSQQSTEDRKKRTLILSDILESGYSDEALYQSVSELATTAKIEKIIGIGKHISEQRDVFENIPNLFFDSTQELIDSGILNDMIGEVILLKGSRSFGFEKISELIEQKTHETVLDVNLDALIHNYKYFRSQLDSKTKIVCMVKANAYGCGAVEVAKALQYHKCDYLAVAVAEEGVELRRAGIKIPIIVLNPEVNGFTELVTNQLEPEIYNFRILEAFIREAEKKSVTDFPIHLKIDTGMHRLGFTEEMIPDLLTKLNTQRCFYVQSVFSHLAASESWLFDKFTEQQMNSFKNISKQIKDGLSYDFSYHILNSAGIERFPSEQMNMVRLGISLYGVSASGLKGLRNVCTLKTTILQIKKVKAGDTVGYGRKGVVDKDTRIATIRIGYADGLSRQFGNQVGQVLVKGKLVPIIGSICMDLTMIDVTDIAVNEGDEVIIYGDNLSVVDLAEKIQTIPYEILTSVSSRVKRVYYRE